MDFSKKIIGGFDYEFVRGVSNGAAEIGECLETMERVRDGDFESWVREWTSTAAAVAAFAESCVRRGDQTTARDAFLKASNYYRMADFYAPSTDPRHTELWKLSVGCFERMIKLADHRVESLAIDFEGAKLPAYFVSGGEGKRPVLIAIGGFDSTKEEVYCWIGESAAENGWHCLIFEGPGQWGALENNPGLVFRPDYEKPLTAAVDYLVARPDVDVDKLALIGYSAGGYFASRAASGEPRIKACIPNSLVVDCGQAARAALKVHNPRLIDFIFGLAMKRSSAARWGFQHAQWSLGITKPHEWTDAYNDFTLKGREESLINPMLFLFGEDDIQNASAATPEILIDNLDFIASLKCDRWVHLFPRVEGASSHCQMGGLSYAHSTIFQWLNHVFRRAGLGEQPLPATREAFVDTIRKYAGEKGAAKARELLEVVHLI